MKTGVASAVRAEASPRRAVRRKARRKLTSTQREIVRMCEHSVGQLSLSRSLGQIFGVIYGSPVPLAFTDVAGSLDLSKGSVSRGLRLLCGLEAIRLVRVTGDRRDLYVLEAELPRAVMRVLHERMHAPLKQGAERLKVVGDRLKKSDEPDREFLAERLESLRAWHRKALLIFLLAQRFLGSDRS